MLMQIEMVLWSIITLPKKIGNGEQQDKGQFIWSIAIRILIPATMKLIGKMTGSTAS